MEWSAYLGVHLERQHDLRGTVPPRRDVLCHQPGLLACAGVRAGADRSCEAKVADLQVTVRVDEQVRRLQVSVYDVCRVDGLESTENLVYEVLAVVV
jgi:hypothetical protein